MNYWLISDTHFNHTKLTEWGGRSGDWQEQIWKGLKAIPKDDILIHLGDICIGNDEEIHAKLWEEVLCAKILVRGNHDKKSIDWYLAHGWDFVVDAFKLDYFGQQIMFSHRPLPLDVWNITKNVHGHTHGNLHRAEEYSAYYDKSYHVDISPELAGYAPLRLVTLLKKGI